MTQLFVAPPPQFSIVLLALLPQLPPQGGLSSGQLPALARCRGRVGGRPLVMPNGPLLSLLRLLHRAHSRQPGPGADILVRIPEADRRGDSRQPPSYGPELVPADAWRSGSSWPPACGRRCLNAPRLLPAACARRVPEQTTGVATAHGRPRAVGTWHLAGGGLRRASAGLPDHRCQLFHSRKGVSRAGRGRRWARGRCRSARG